MNNLRKRFILLMVSILLLVAVVIYLTFAWFTRMTSVSGMDFNVTKWDFTANHAVSDIMVNVYEYSTLSRLNIAAPGTAGWIPLMLGAGESETDIEFFVTVDKSTMSDEFIERIKFYYKNESGQMVEITTTVDGLEGVIKAGQTLALNLYWEWIYEYEPKQGEGPAQIAENSKLHDEFDTKVGKNPELYSRYMSAAIRITGAQVLPELVEEQPPAP